MPNYGEDKSTSSSSLSSTDAFAMSLGGWEFDAYCGGERLDKAVKRHFNPHTVIDGGLPLVSSEKKGLYSGFVHSGIYKAYCTLAPLDVGTPHTMYYNSSGEIYDDVVVHGGPKLQTFKRTRYRACCSPVIIHQDDVAYILINTDLNTLTVYRLPEGEKVYDIPAPEMMTAILPDEEDPDILHLFGWIWSPIEIHCNINFRDILAKAKAVEAAEFGAEQNSFARGNSPA